MHDTFIQKILKPVKNTQGSFFTKVKNPSFYSSSLTNGQTHNNLSTTTSTHAEELQTAAQ